MLIGMVLIAGGFFATDQCPGDSAHGPVVCLSAGCTAKEHPCTPKPAYLVGVVDPDDPLGKKPLNSPTPKPQPDLVLCASITPPSSVPTLQVGKSYDFTVTFSRLAQTPFSLEPKGATVQALGSVSDGKQTYRVTPQRPSFTLQATVAETSKCSKPVPLVLQAEEGADCVALSDSFKPGGEDTGNDAPPDPAAAPNRQKSKKKPWDIDKLVSLLGNPQPLSLVAGDANILVYSSTPEARVYGPALTRLREAVRRLTELGVEPPDQPDKLRQLEFPVPRRAIADVLPNPPSDQFSLELEYPGMLLISEKKKESCKAWMAMLDSIERAAIGPMRESPVSRLFYLKAADKTADAIGGATKAKPASTPDQSPDTTDSSGKGSSSDTGGGKSSGDSSNSGDSGGTKGKADEGASNSKTQPNAKTSDSASSSASGGSGDKSKSSPAGASKPPAVGNSSDKSSSSQGTSKPSGDTSLSVNSLEDDLLIFSGDDRKILDAKRVLAMLDLPRPEMIINAWILQASTDNPDEVGRFNDIARRFVSQNNDALQQGIGRGWAVVRSSIQYDPDFYRYLTYRYVGDTGDLESMDSKDEKLHREALAICAKHQYCMGYTKLFNPLRPRVTDLLLAIIASKNPVEVARQAVGAVEGGYWGCSGRECDELRERLNISPKWDGSKCRLGSCSRKSSKPAEGAGVGEEPAAASAMPDSETPAENRPANENLSKYGRWSDCGKRDLERLVNSAGPEFLSKGRSPQFQLECFLGTVERLFEAQPTDSKHGDPYPAQSLARAALADFLFNYKMSQEYPHEFDAYSLTQSADVLNNALSPFIDAFNRDVAAFQEYLNNVVSMAVSCRRCGKTTFTNSGLVTVRTVSTNTATVSSTTQSFLDASTFPDLATLAQNVFGAQPAGGTGANAKKTADILNNLSFNEAQVLTGALQSYQSSQAQIGRAIDLKVTPRSLSGASSAEMDITLKADESGSPTRFTGATSRTYNLSRVATHDTTTHVRVDSLKLFEVSAVGAQLTLSRPPIPLILPLVELPYIGSIVGIPRKPAEEYHSSVAIMSAMVVPTAADLAYGLEFVYDHVIPTPRGFCTRPWSVAPGNAAAPDPPLCKSAAAAAHGDLEGSVSAYHRVKLECIATGRDFAYAPDASDPTAQDSDPGRQSLCGVAAGSLTFDKLPPVL
jgi:hypothetical protein